MPAFIKKILTIIVSIAALLLLVALVVPYIAKPDQMLKAAQGALASEAGLELKTEGEAAVTTFPSPKAYFKTVALNKDGKSIVSAASAVVHIGWLGLFQQHAQSVEFVQAQINLPRQMLNETLAGLTKPPPQNSTLPNRVQLTNATLNFIDVTSAENAPAPAPAPAPVSLKNINGELSLGSIFSLNTQFTYHDKPVEFRADVDASISKPAKLEALLAGAHIVMQGSLEQMSPLKWVGTANADIPDIAALTNVFINQPQQASSTSVTTPINLNFEGKAFFQDGAFTLPRTEATFDGQKAGLSAYFGLHQTTSIALELDTEKAKLDKWYQIFSPLLLASSVPVRIGVAPEVVTPLGDDTLLYLILKANDAEYWGKNFKKFDLHAEIEHGTVVVHHAEAQMPGNSSISIAGRVTQQPEGRRFNGTLALKGEHFNDWLADIEPTAKDLPADDFSNFAVQGNLFFSKDQLRLSEANLNIHDFELSGGFVAYLDDKPRVEADVRLRNANLDYFRDAWREMKKNSSDPTYQVLLGDVSKFNWLKKIPTKVDFTIAIDGFTFLEQQGNAASMRLYITPAEINLYGINLQYPDNNVSGNITFNVAGIKPKLSLIMSADRLNSSYLSAEENEPYVSIYDVTRGDKRFSDALFDLRWMGALDMILDISLGTLIYHDQDYTNFKWNAELANSSMTIKSLGFNYLGGSFELAGTLIGGKVPGLSASFGLYSASLPELLKIYFDSDRVNAGNVSITGAILTSGINPQAWLDQGEMKLTASARGVRVQNFNLQSVINVAAQARSTTDVAEGVKNRLFDGNTTLAVDGTFNIKDAMIKTPGIQLGYNNVHGTLTGEMAIKPWTINLSTLWQFPELNGNNIPTMTVSQQGSLNEFTTRLDTSSLESFVAKRIVGQ